MKTLRCDGCAAVVTASGEGPSHVCRECGGKLTEIRPGQSFMTFDGWSARYMTDADGRLWLEYEYEDGVWREAETEQSSLFDNRPEYE